MIRCCRNRMNDPRRYWVADPSCGGWDCDTLAEAKQVARRVTDTTNSSIGIYERGHGQIGYTIRAGGPIHGLDELPSGVARIAD